MTLKKQASTAYDWGLNKSERGSRPLELSSKSIKKEVKIFEKLDDLDEEDREDVILKKVSNYLPHLNSPTYKQFLHKLKRHV